VATVKTIPIRCANVGDLRLLRCASRVCTSGLLWVLVCLLVPACMAQQKRRVAVLNFDYGTVQSSVAAIFGGNQDVGKGISDLLVQKLVQDGKYSVIERNALDKVLGEQNFANSDRADSSTAAKIGRILGVDAVIVGSITQFGRDDKNTTVGGSVLGNYGSKYGLGGVGKTKSKAVVGISARMVDTSTAEILAAVTGTGQSTRSGTSLLGAGGGGGDAASGNYDMSSSNFADTILGEAVHQAVDSTATQLDQEAAVLPTRKVEISGLVADVTGTTLILNVGSKAGVKVGDMLDISRPVKTVKDPATGKVLKTITAKMGMAVVTEVDEQSATASYNGTSPAKVGDSVNNSQ
jgi:curli biogenesis system outer membrane secretion channel CsgG